MSPFFWLIVLLFLYMSVWFIVAQFLKRNDIADVAWGLGFIFLAWSAWFMFDTMSWRSLLVNILVSLWGVRLAAHIYARNRRKTEDYRYLSWRKQWGKWFFIRSYLQVFLLQGLFLFIISTPVVYMNNHTQYSVTVFDVIGVLIWIIGFYFEAVGDWQLSKFLSQPEHKGMVMQSGLWRYSRHPNYFGEVTQWWGIFLIGLSIPGSWFTVVGPILITILIVFVSGVPLLEKKYDQRPEYQAYKKQTSVFFPLPRR